MDTANGGWTLAYSYTNLISGVYANAVTPRPNWPNCNEIKNSFTNISTTPPTGENDFAAMNTSLWHTIGGEILIKTNIFNWYSCAPFSHTLWTEDSIKVNCHKIKNVPNVCADISPTMISPLYCRLRLGDGDKIIKYTIPTRTDQAKKGTRAFGRCMVNGTYHNLIEPGKHHYGSIFIR